MLKITYLLFLVAVVLPWASAQDANDTDSADVFVRTNTNKEVYIKVFGADLLYPEGLNFYVKKSGSSNWEIMNSAPVKPLSEPSMQAMADTSGKKEEWINTIRLFTDEGLTTTDGGFILFVLALQAIESNELTNLLGIQYRVPKGLRGKNNFQVRKVTANGEVVLGTSNELKVGKPVLRTEVQQVKPLASDRKIHLSWELNDSDYYAYNVYRYTVKKNGTPVKINSEPIMMAYEDELPTTFVTDTALNNETRYYYEVYGIDAFGIESAASERVSAVPVDKTAPKAPYGLRLEQTSDGKISLQWEFIAEKDLAGFNVLRSISTDSVFTKANPALITPKYAYFQDDPSAVLLQSGTNYTYYIEAVDKKGNAAFSDFVTTGFSDELAPQPVSNVNFTLAHNAISLEWDQNTEPDFLGYRVYKKNVRSNKEYRLLTPRPTPNSFFVDSIPSNSKDAFSYKICALDSSYNRSKYSKPLTLSVKDIVPPPTPFFTTGVSDTLATIRIAPVQVPDLASFIIYSKTDDGVEKLVTLSAAQTEYQFPIHELTTVSVSAVDDLGNESARSDWQTMQVNSTIPVAKITNLNHRLNTETGSLELTWQTSLPVEKAIIQRREVYEKSFAVITEVKDNTYTDQLPAGSSGFVYKIILIDTNGNRSISAPYLIAF